MMDAHDIHVFLGIELEGAPFFKYMIGRLLESLFRNVAWRSGFRLERSNL